MKTLSASALLFLCVSVPAHALDLQGLSHPESIVVDPASGDFYVSNVGGSPAEKDNDGYISKIDADGVVTVLKFITAREHVVELHAPKGLAIVDGVLYAVDIDAVKVFSVANGEPTGTISLGNFEPKFLNDITADSEGRLYVSDMLANRIYRIDTKDSFKVTIFKEGGVLGRPNGVLFNPRTKGLIVAGSKTGQLLEIDRKGRVMILRKDLGGGLDGLTADRNGMLFISSYEKGEIYSVENWGRGPLSLFQSGLSTPADISYDGRRHEILVPLMSKNAVTSFKISPPER